MTQTVMPGKARLIMKACASIKHVRFIYLLVVTSLLCAFSAAHGETLTTIHSFGAFAGDGWYPTGRVALGPGGTLYGTTLYGGTSSQACGNTGCGTVFALTPPASSGGSWTESVYSFRVRAGDVPYGGVAVGRNGVIYGSTMSGGPCGGTVFALRSPSSVNSWAEKLLFDNCGTAYGLDTAPAIGAGGVLYMTANGVGAASGPGTVFTLRPPSGVGGGWTEEVLYSGLVEPSVVAIGPRGVLYGTCFGGGVSNPSCGTVGCGSVFSLTPPAVPGGSWTARTLYNFNGSEDGGNPVAGVVIGPGGVLYGTTTQGGNAACPYGCGTAFALTPPNTPGGAWTEAILYRFTGSADGSYPNASLAIDTHGVLYGTTAYGATRFGGYCDALHGCGSVFSLTPPSQPGGTWVATVLYTFIGGSGGGQPLGVIVGPNGVLYGATYGGGVNGFGTVFSLAP